MYRTLACPQAIQTSVEFEFAEVCIVRGWVGQSVPMAQPGGPSGPGPQLVGGGGVAADTGGAEQQQDPQQPEEEEGALGQGAAVVTFSPIPGKPGWVRATLSGRSEEELEQEIGRELAGYFEAHRRGDTSAIDRQACRVQLLALHKLRSLVTRHDFIMIGSGGPAHAPFWTDNVFRYDWRDGLTVAGALGRVGGSHIAADTSRFHQAWSSFVRAGSITQRLLRDGFDYSNDGTVSQWPSMAD